MPSAAPRLRVNPEADVLDISLTERRRPGVQHEKVATGVYLGWAANRLAGIQVLQASKHVPLATLQRIDSAAELCTPRELAREHGLVAGSIANAAAAGRLPGAMKRGGTWLLSGGGDWCESLSACARGSDRVEGVLLRGFLPARGCAPAPGLAWHAPFG